jgi:hypothetical protein
LKPVQLGPLRLGERDRRSEQHDEEYRDQSGATRVIPRSAATRNLAAARDAARFLAALGMTLLER